ncbi:lipase [Marinactinospora endophytica]
MLVAGAAAGLLLACAAPATAAQADGEPASGGLIPTLPEPTGRHTVGVTELHLVQQGRPDPWLPDRDRELMVGIWYPAKADREARPAPYMPEGTAEILGAEFTATLGLDPEAIDYGAITSAGLSGAPADTRSGPRPVVLFSPGGGVSRTLGTALVQELASHGYVVVTVDHTGEAPVQFPGGRVETSRLDDMPEDNPYLAMTDARVDDVRFVLDQLEEIASGDNPDAQGRALPRGLARVLDLSRIGAFGHSAGGATSIHAMAEDDQIDAAVDMDGSVVLGRNEAEREAFRERFPASTEGVTRPFMFMGAAQEEIPEEGGEPVVHPNTHVTFEDWGRLWENSPGWKRDLNFPEARHFTFTDHLLFLPRIQSELGLPPEVVASVIGPLPDPGRAYASQHTYLRAFFDLHLRGLARPVLDGESPHHPDVRFVP